MTVAATGLTVRQHDCLLVIERLMREGNQSPTVQEIATAMKMPSRGGVHALLVGLRARGRIDWKPKLTRSIVLLTNRAQHILPASLQDQLERYCAANDEAPSDVIADAVALHFDALDMVDE